jgi:hypothetical protein
MESKPTGIHGWMPYTGALKKPKDGPRDASTIGLTTYKVFRSCAERHVYRQLTQLRVSVGNADLRSRRFEMMP